MNARYLWPADYMADPAAHVWNGRLYIYPSHDRESGIPENDRGDHFDMKDYHVLSIGPQVGWTTHHSVTEVEGKWYLFHHDSVPSGGRTWLRSLKVRPLI